MLTLVKGERSARYAEKSDDDLMLLARGGVPAAFDALVRRHQARVIDIARRNLNGSLTLAEDVAQETFVELYRYLGRYRPDGKLRVLLYRIIINRCRMTHRSSKRSRLVLTDPPEQIVDPIAEQEVLRRERQRAMDRLLAELSPALRSVVTLRFTGDLTNPEIAEVLGIPVGTVKSRLFHGLAKLRAMMKEGTP